MNKQARSRKFTTKQSARLGAYLAAGLGASTVATSSSDAAIVGIDLGPTGFNIAGPNAGLSLGSLMSAGDFPFYGAGTMYLSNNAYSIYTGLIGAIGLLFAVNGGYASPTNFGLNASIGSGANWDPYDPAAMLFRFDPVEGEVATSAPFGPGSYMGFRTAQGNYGWLEVTWDSKSSQFEILSGAYEDVPGVAINAGATAPIPEPGTWVALAVFAGGAAFARWRKRRDEAQQEAAA